MHQGLKYIVVVMAAISVGWFAYEGFLARPLPGDYAYYAASNYFADGRYASALKEYEAALAANPRHMAALRGRAETLIVLGREREAIEIYDKIITLQPDNPGHYANRGIAYDRLGDHAKALADYEKSLNLDPKIGTGPSWLTRFLRNQAEKPPGIIDRARYLRKQLALPPSQQRLLQVPEIDAAQRPYKL